MRDAIDLKYATSMLFYATLVLVVAFIILNTLLMSVLERTREFGMLLALGMRPAQIGAMVWIELLALALLGCAIGVAIGGARHALAAVDRHRSFRSTPSCWPSSACRRGSIPASARSAH